MEQYKVRRGRKPKKVVKTRKAYRPRKVSLFKRLLKFIGLK